LIANFFERNPALRTFIIISVGYIIGRFVHLDELIILIMITVLLVTSLLIKNNKFNHLILITLLLIVGIYRIYIEREKVIFDNLIIDKINKEVELTGKVETFNYDDDRVVLRLKRIAIKDYGIKLNCKILAHLKDIKSVEGGDIVNIRGDLFRPSESRNPGEFDYRRYLNIHGITGIVYADEISVIKKSKWYDLNRLFYLVNHKIIKVIDSGLSTDNSPVLKALILGQRGELTDELKNDFVNAGVIHVLAVSGLHVGYITIIILIILGFFRFPDRVKTVSAIFILCFYAGMVGFKPSVVRAVIMASLLLIARSWEFPFSLYNIIFSSALIQSLINPLQIFDIGYQLSYIAVISILYFYKKLDYCIPQRIKEIVKEHRAINYIYQLFLVSLSALIGTLPIVSYNFHRIPIISMVSNLIVVPLVGLIVMVGLAQVLLGLVYNFFNVIYGEVTDVLITILKFIIKKFGGMSFSYISIPGFGLITFLLFYIFIIIAFNIEKRTMRKVGILLVLLLLNIQIWAGIFRSPVINVTFLDVGQGDAIFIRFPSGKNMLVDSGPKRYNFDSGKRIIAPFLNYKGVKKINYFVLTHPHSDHIGGAEYIIKNFTVDTLILSNISRVWKYYTKFCNLVDSLNIAIKEVNTGDILIPDRFTIVYVLWPIKNLQNISSVNNNSVVLRISNKDMDILLPGDIEKKAEDSIVLFEEFVRSEILKVPHHGSKTSSSEEFLLAVYPDVAVISVGANNLFGHPHQAVINKFKNLGVKIFRTDNDCAVLLKLYDSYYSVKSYKKGREIF